MNQNNIKGIISKSYNLFKILELKPKVTYIRCKIHFSTFDGITILFEVQHVRIIQFGPFRQFKTTF